MPDTLRFHLDEHISQAVAEGLRQHGIEVTTTAEAGLKAISDRQQFAFATKHRRVMVTSDSDFLRLHHEGVSHAGIAYCKQGRRSLGQMIRSLVALWQRCTPKDMQNQVEFL